MNKIQLFRQPGRCQTKMSFFRHTRACLKRFSETIASAAPSQMDLRIKLRLLRKSLCQISQWLERRATGLYLFYRLDPSVACPWSMSHEPVPFSEPNKGISTKTGAQHVPSCKPKINASIIQFSIALEHVKRLLGVGHVHLASLKKSISLLSGKLY